MTRWWRRGGRALLVVAVVAMGAKLSALGCDDSGSHIFSGEEYSASSQCLGPVSSIDIVTGPDPGSCPPACIVSLLQDGGRVAYVSTMCPPYPVFQFETDASGDPLCVGALEAFKEDAFCADGGKVVWPADAGAEAGDGGDGGDG